MALPLLLSHDFKGLQTFQDHLLCVALCPKWPSIANSYKVEISYNNIKAAQRRIKLPYITAVFGVDLAKCEPKSCAHEYNYVISFSLALFC